MDGPKRSYVELLPEDYVAVLEVANAEKQKEKLKILSSQLYRVKEYADIKTE